MNSTKEQMPPGKHCKTIKVLCFKSFDACTKFAENYRNTIWNHRHPNRPQRPIYASWNPPVPSATNLGLDVTTRGAVTPSLFPL